jgi:hypothetical protein
VAPVYESIKERIKAVTRDPAFRLGDWFDQKDTRVGLQRHQPLIVNLVVRSR